MRSVPEVQYAFTNQGKLDQGATHRLLKIEVEFRDLAVSVFDLVPDGPDKTVALRKLLEAKMVCSQAISHPGKTSPQTGQEKQDVEKQAVRKKESA